MRKPPAADPPPPPESAEDDAPPRHPGDLTTYFRDGLRHDLLGAQGEVDLGRQIETLDVRLGVILFSYRPRPDFLKEALEAAGIDATASRRTARALVALVRQEDLATIPNLCRQVLKAKDPDLARLRKAIEPLYRQVAALRERFILANLRLVIRIAKTFARRVPFGDAIQDGNIGLMRAVDRWDYRKGFRFSTYATWWIRQAIARTHAETGSLVRLPVHVQDTQGQVKKAQRHLAHVLGRPPSIEEVATHSGEEATKVEQLLNLGGGPLSLDAPLSSGDGQLLDVFSDEAPNAEDVLSSAEDRARVRQGLGKLSSVHRQVLEARMERRTLRVIGLERGCSRERIRQIEEVAAGRLRYHISNPEARADPDPRRERAEAMDRACEYLARHRWAEREDLVAILSTSKENARNWISAMVRKGRIAHVGNTYFLPDRATSDIG